jgi:MFS transporter, ACS family, glucarate transporter
VGCLHRIDRRNRAQYDRHGNNNSSLRDPFSPWRGRSHHLSRVQPVRRTPDTESRTRRGQRNHLRRGGDRRGSNSALISFIMLHYGWRSSFLMSALIGLAAGAVWFLAARDTPEAHPSVSSGELMFIQQGIPKPTTAEKSRLLSWSTILSTPNVWILSLAYFCVGYVAWIFFSWFYVYLAKVRGLDLKASALYATLPFLAMAICSPFGGAISDAVTKRFGSRLGRCSIAVFGFTLTAIFVAFGSLAQDTRVASFVLAGGARSLYLSQSSFWAVSDDLGLGGKSSGSLSGFMNMA